jgi:hypothetical protein
MQKELTIRHGVKNIKALIRNSTYLERMEVPKVVVS